MGKTYRKDTGWKRDRRDQNFRKSKKFKDFKSGKLQPKHNPPLNDKLTEPQELEFDDTSYN